MTRLSPPRVRIPFLLAAVLSVLLLLFTHATASSLHTVCAVPTCLFKNGSICDRMSIECPRCVSFDSLLDASICSHLLTNGTACAADYTLCPETPLDAAAAPTGDDAASDAYDWVEVGSAATGSTTDGSGCVGRVAVPDAAATPLAPRTESTARPPKSATAADAAPTPSEAASRHTGSRGSSSLTLPPWLIITLAVVVALVAALLASALYMQRADRRNHARGDCTTPVPPPRSSVGEDIDYNGGAKDQISPNSYGFGFELSSMRSNDARVVSSRSNMSSGSSPTSSRNDTNDSVVPTSFAHRMDAPQDLARQTQSFPATRTVLGLSRTPVQSLPPLQPRSRTPGWSSSAPSPPPPPPPPRSSSSSTQSRFAQYSFPRFTSDARVTMPSSAAVSRSWTTNEFELMDDTSSSASASCDDEGDDVFLTDNSSASAFAECDYVDAQTPGQASTGAPRSASQRDGVDIYPDTSKTTLTETGRMFSPLSMRTRDTAAFKGDVVAEWASLRGDTTAASDAKREQQQHEKLAHWKAKFYQEL